MNEELSSWTQPAGPVPPAGYICDHKQHIPEIGGAMIAYNQSDLFL